MIQLDRTQLTSQTPFRWKILRAFVFLFIGNSILSIGIFFERRKCVYSVVIFNKGIEETFEVSWGNFYDNCPQRAIIQGQLFGGQSCRQQLLSEAIVWGVGAIVRGGDNHLGSNCLGAIIWGQFSTRAIIREAINQGAIVRRQINQGGIFLGGNCPVTIL